MRHFSLKNISIYQKPVFADSFAPLSPPAVSLLHYTPSNNPTASQGQFRIHSPPIVWGVEITQLFSLLC